MSGSPRVVLVRPWTQGRGGGGCCGGEVRDGITLDGDRTAPADGRRDPVGAVYLRLAQERPDLDVQVVDAGNPWLTAWTFRAVRRRAGLRAALVAALRSGTPGAVLVDGVHVADVADGPERVDATLAGRAPCRAPTGRLTR